MKKSKREKFYNHMEQIIFHCGNEDDQEKIEFVKKFLKDYFQIEDEQNSFINLEKMGYKTFLYFFASLLMSFEDTFQNPKEQLLLHHGFNSVPPFMVKLEEEKKGKIKRIKKDRWYVEVELDDIFPIGEFTIEEVRLIEDCLDKIHLDIECTGDIILSTKDLIHLITGVIRLSKEKPK